MPTKKGERKNMRLIKKKWKLQICAGGNETIFLFYTRIGLLAKAKKVLQDVEWERMTAFIYHGTEWVKFFTLTNLRGGQNETDKIHQ